ncbi:hypothetical protein [Amnibacterium endophyticum]|uniref:Glycosyltransferase n=1 Tax=Amnibacterium endophyticum TaxID=2109337 RepID=A0ABW4LBS0_9MICO
MIARLRRFLRLTRRAIVALVVEWYYTASTPLRARRRYVPTSGIEVSLTSHGERLQRVHVAVESILRGAARPRRVILWVDDAVWARHPPKRILSQLGRGLEVRLSQDFGPHTKYFPYCTRVAGPSGTAFVTADDDIIYPRRWLSGLLRGAAEHPDDAIAYLVRRIELHDGELLPYRRWGPVLDGSIGVENFALGVSGVLYPPAFAALVQQLGERFLVVCPRADDVWINSVLLQASVRVRPVERAAPLFPTVWSTDASALRHANVAGGENDAQIAGTYTATLRARLIEAAGPGRHG